MSVKFSVAVIGCGGFARGFVPLFKAHPAVGTVSVCDLIPERAKEYSEKFEVPIIDTFENALADPSVDAIAVFTQRHLHGPMVIKALYAGKHVYSAVPMASEPDECRQIIEAVNKTRKIYMMGETCIYYPCAMYCKAEYEKGTFGRFVYGEAQYYHDLSHFGAQYNSDRMYSAGLPPFLYPTHSTAMMLWATGAYVTRVTALGYVDKEPDTPFAVGENVYGNSFSNEFSLMQLSNGGVARINECRRIGFKAPSSSVQSFYGTRGGYQFSNAQHILTTLTPTGVDLRDVSAEVNPMAMENNRTNDVEFKRRVANHGWAGSDFSPPQAEDVKRLPASYEKLGSGHMGSHKFLIDDFCTAVRDNKLPRVNAWFSARCTIPGLLAHESAKLGGVPINVPDYGDAPEDWE